MLIGELIVYADIRLDCLPSLNLIYLKLKLLGKAEFVCSWRDKKDYFDEKQSCCSYISWM